MLSQFFGKNGGKNDKTGLRTKILHGANFFASGILQGAKINSQILTNLETGKKEKNTLYNIINI